MLAHKMHPFNFLLIEAEGATTARAPTIVRGQPNAGVLQYSDYAFAIDTHITKRHLHRYHGIRRDIALPVTFISADRYITRDPVAFLEKLLHPRFKRLNLELLGAPPSARRG